MPARVMRVITRLNIGGPARHVFVLSEGLERHGFESLLVTGSEGHREGALQPERPIRLHHVRSLQRGVNPLRDLRTGLELYRLMKSYRPAIVHTHLAKAGALGRLAAMRAGVPAIVHTFHGHVLSGYFPRPVTATLIAFERRMARASTCLVAVSDQIRDELLALRIGTPEKWRVVPLGLELDYLLTSSVDRAEGRGKLGLPSEGPAVGIVGRLARIKDVDTFIAAGEILSEDFPEATFVVAGDGPLRDELEQRGAALGSRIRFLGWVTDLPSLYAALDVVVLTSRNEGTPVALIEASAAGRPVVGTVVGGVPAVVQDGLTGFLVPPADPAATAERIGWLLSNPSRASEMGQAGRQYVRDRFAAERLVGDVASLYEELLDGKRR